VVSKSDADPVVRQFRERISDNDLKLVQAINQRLKLVAQLKKYKEEHQMEFYDPDRERWMLTFVSRANKGPLSPAGLEKIFTDVLALTKSEMEDGGK
jgi:chorismate mutase